MTYLRSISVRAPAKVNLQLGVGGRRDDGYHELASVFLAVSLSDRITLTAAEELRVTVGGPRAADVPADASNIAARAVELLAKRSGLHPGVHVHIDKHIPVQGGMAGGSADAAGALVGCDALWNLGLGRPELLSLAAELGSDVPFSLVGGAAFGSGRGERLTVLPVGATTHWVFATAGFGLSTPAVFAEQERRRRSAGVPWTADGVPSPLMSRKLVDALAAGDTASLADALGNDLEPVATSMRPQLTATLKSGTDAGALAGILCGSGATIGFLVSDGHQARTVAQKLLASGTCTSAHIAAGPVPGPEPEEIITTGENG
ncbi:4-(cytidine 5'-diphospho)-2-C-methyl-D-erythritol kinase [Streptomyces sp. NPDC029003]|uniref:4-(cytidine 5'-diphospho)-2-C-methyl-D-erythritol kinase n=1 Tax=Streptomyces sp. NPDC029003 TaxID=3155125 RepID=UPI0033F4DB12